MSKRRVEIVVEHTPGATPGPWHVGGIVYLNEGRFMNVWGPTPPGAQSGQIIAHKLSIPDAHMIAASLDMYEALKATRIWVQIATGHPTSAPTLTIIDAAIAKAEGKS